ncbi:hypothetical protein QYE76_029362 [Lolium multiflorum]|uniref:RNase H type-1 domain-containing protein n=1 Tax=Lolium multiflorum TaxID=4521 RepID=A0AAD8VGL8_LOLMU|nr:hypothetical protein QYE76_029362 [Lolium multiflorum]
MASYRFHIQQLSGFFDGCEFHHVPRANNEAADALSKIGSTRQAIPPGIALAVIKKPSIIPSPDSDSMSCPADPGLLSRTRGLHRPRSGAHQPNPPASSAEPCEGSSTRQMHVRLRSNSWLGSLKPTSEKAIGTQCLKDHGLAS